MAARTISKTDPSLRYAGKLLEHLATSQPTNKQTFLLLLVELKLGFLVEVAYFAQLLLLPLALLVGLGEVIMIAFQHHLEASQLLLNSVEFHA